MGQYASFDQEALETHFNNDKDLIAELVNVFDETHLETLNEIKESFEGQNFEVLERSSHTLKGMVANFFSEKIRESAYFIEQKSREKDLTDVKDKIDLIENDLKQLMQDLKAYCGVS
jgi:HPt (histidine-containing phosphotransfer) domain-containing protein